MDIKDVEAKVVLSRAPSASSYGQESLDRAATHYRQNRTRLEEHHYDKYVRIDVATGYLVVEGTRRSASEEFKRLCVERVAYTFHIGTTYRNA